MTHDTQTNLHDFKPKALTHTHTHTHSLSHTHVCIQANHDRWNAKEQIYNQTDKVLHLELVSWPCEGGREGEKEREREREKKKTYVYNNIYICIKPARLPCS